MVGLRVLGFRALGFVFRVLLGLGAHKSLGFRAIWFCKDAWRGFRAHTSPRVMCNIVGSSFKGRVILVLAALCLRNSGFYSVAQFQQDLVTSEPLHTNI